jgi:hypothetical protein
VRGEGCFARLVFPAAEDSGGYRMIFMHHFHFKKGQLLRWQGILADRKKS